MTCVKLCLHTTSVGTYWQETPRHPSMDSESLPCLHSNIYPACGFVRIAHIATLTETLVKNCLEVLPPPKDSFSAASMQCSHQLKHRHQQAVYRLTPNCLFRAYINIQACMTLFQCYGIAAHALCKGYFDYKTHVRRQLYLTDKVALEQQFDKHETAWPDYKDSTFLVTIP